MITAQEIKYIRSLQRKKFRQQYGAFVVEGVKAVNELLNSSLKTEAIYGLKDALRNLPSGNKASEVGPRELKKISNLKTPNQLLAVAKIPETKIESGNWQSELIIVLDQMNDPGNLGTIIRIADWFGIEHIICSEDTVDAYNPKVVQASMGSIFRTQIHYTELEGFLEQYRSLGGKVYASDLEGENIYEAQLPATGAIVIGSESHGTSSDLRSQIDGYLYIPSFGSGKAESLNAAMACSIICSEFRRRMPR